MFQKVMGMTPQYNQYCKSFKIITHTSLLKRFTEKFKLGKLSK